ncbi:MAG: hypothetical protein IJY15_12425, partial [Thermoguttaceae bacterium]|nr:hypothetical protein [Thermoguttaceae bacterium]
ATAPRINRFDIRQDGDTSKLGEFKWLPNPDKTFDPNKRVAEEQFRALREQLAKEDLKVELVSATYGAKDKKVDVLPMLKEKFFNGTRLLTCAGKYNDHFGDPIYNTKKTLDIEYKINGETKKVSFQENAQVLLPK